jgi:AcrR family transcriptional regulator
MAAPERRSAILDAALEVFAARGYHGSSIDEIAQQAGISKALIYEHFTSKKELHGELLATYVAELFGRLEANASMGTTGEDRLRGGVDAFLGFVEENRVAFRVLFRDAADPEVAEVLETVQAQAVGVIAALITADPEAILVQIADESERRMLVETHAAMLSGAVQALAAWWEENQEVPRAELVERVMEFTWIGIEQLRSGRRITR